MRLLGSKGTGSRSRQISAVLGIALSLSLSGAMLAEGAWEQREDGWYYLQEDNSPASGWIEDGMKSYYLYEDGRCATDCITPDGYYVDESGAWYIRSMSTVKDLVFMAPGRFVKPETGQEGWYQKEKLEQLRNAVVRAFGGARTISISDSAIEYLSVKDKKVLIGLYKEVDQSRYRLDLGIRLNRESTEDNQAQTYDYAVYKALLYQFSASADVLEQAIYSGWQGSNQWGINRSIPVNAGDSRILYKTVSGFGRFWIDARPGE